MQWEGWLWLMLHKNPPRLLRLSADREQSVALLTESGPSYHGEGAEVQRLVAADAADAADAASGLRSGVAHRLGGRKQKSGRTLTNKVHIAPVRCRHWEKSSSASALAEYGAAGINAVRRQASFLSLFVLQLTVMCAPPDHMRLPELRHLVALPQTDALILHGV